MGPKRRKIKTEEDEFNTLFNKGLVNFLGRTYTNAIIDGDARDLTAKFLYNFLTVSIKEMKVVNDQKASVEYVQRAMQVLLPPSLFKFAASEAQKELFMIQAVNLEALAKVTRKPKTADKLVELMQMKEQDAVVDTVIDGVDDLLELSMSHCRFDRYGNKKISAIMVSLLDALVQELKERNPEKVTVEELQALVQDFFPPSLGEHAKSEGQRMLFEHAIDAFDFKPDITGVGLPAARSPAEIEMQKDTIRDLQSGLNRITDTIHPDGALANNSKKLLASNLNILITKMVKHLKEQTGKKTYKMLDGSIKDIFPKLMSEHANAEGVKMIRRFETGEYDFDTKAIEESVIGETKTTPNKMAAIKHLGPGIVALGKSISSKINLPRSTVRAIGVDLSTLCDLILSKTKEAEVYPTFHDIQRAAEDVMPRSMADHAIAEGEKMISLHEMKAITFNPNSKEEEENKKKIKRKKE